MSQRHSLPGDSRPRVLFVGAFPPHDRVVFGGMVTACRTLIESSFSQRHQLDLLDSTQLSNPPPRIPIRCALAVRRLTLFAIRVVRRRPDVVLLFAASGLSLLEKGAMARFARAFGVPAVLFPRAGATMDSWKKGRFHMWWIRWAFGGASKIFCQGERWQSFFVQDVGVSIRDAPIIPNWTASSDLLDIGRNRRGRTGLPVRLLFVGWLEREKGVEELLAACCGLSLHTDFTLTVVGEGRLSSSARDQVARCNLSRRVHFCGWLRGGALHHALKEADVLVLPSRAEGMPNVVIEALAAGLAVVTTPVGSIQDFIVDGQHAVLTPAGDAAALKTALLRVIEDPVFRWRLGQAGHELAASKFNVDNAADLMAKELDMVRIERAAIPDRPVE